MSYSKEAFASTRQSVLQAMPGTIVELREKTKLANTTVWRHIQDAMIDKKCYVSGWRRDKQYGPMVAVYMRGKGTSVPRL